MKTQYVPTTEAEIPAGLRFDVPLRLQGQTIERAYGGPMEQRGMHDDGAPYMRVLDRSVGSRAYRYWRLLSE